MEFLDQSLRQVFVDMQCSGLWPDQKVFSDSILLAPAQDICAAYDAAKAAGEVDLQAFYKQFFRPITVPGGGYQNDPRHSPTQHLAAIWPHLMRDADDPGERSTRIPLPHPYVVVGGRFQEAYYWDSYFTQLGLLKTGQHEAVRAMLDNFAYAIAEFGHIPNGFRSYFLTRSQPPFFAAMVQDYGNATGNLAAAYAEYRDAIAVEYRYFTETEHTVNGLARYWDSANSPRIEMYGTDVEWLDHAAKTPNFFRDLRAACESGWDFSARWLTDPADLGTIRTTRIWPIDLNCLLLRVEEILAAAFADDPARAAEYQAAADQRRHAIQKRFFDEKLGYFFDVSIDDGRIIPITTAAGMFALYAGAATQDQAERAAAYMETHLLRKGGLLTTDINSGQQWDSPNGWAPLQWIAIKGLRRYGLTELAETLRQRWLASCDIVFRQSGKFVEKYNMLDPENPSSGGEYALQDGFGWTNGVYLDLSDG